MTTLTKCVYDILISETKGNNKCMLTVDIIKKVNQNELFKTASRSSIYSSLKSLEKQKLISCGYTNNKRDYTWFAEKICLYLGIEEEYKRNKMAGIMLLMEKNFEMNNLVVSAKEAQQFLENSIQ